MQNRQLENTVKMKSNLAKYSIVSFIFSTIMGILKFRFGSKLTLHTVCSYYEIDF